MPPLPTMAARIVLPFWFVGIGSPLAPASDSADGSKLVFEIDEFLAAGHHLRDAVAGDVALRVGSQALAAIEHREAIRDRIGVVHIVRDEDDAQAAGAGAGDDAQHDRRLMHAERR